MSQISAEGVVVVQRLPRLVQWLQPAALTVSAHDGHALPAFRTHALRPPSLTGRRCVPDVSCRCVASVSRLMAADVSALHRCHPLV